MGVHLTAIVKAVVHNVDTRIEHIEMLTLQEEEEKHRMLSSKRKVEDLSIDFDF
jgi:hypothetical protein